MAKNEVFLWTVSGAESFAQPGVPFHELLSQGHDIRVILLNPHVVNAKREAERWRRPERRTLSRAYSEPLSQFLSTSY
ncbi:MAG: hypothetical protein V4568_15340 [Pseudomonadota bacterium]